MEYGSTDIDLDLAYTALSEAIGAFNEWMSARNWSWTENGTNIRYAGASYEVQKIILQGWGNLLFDPQSSISFGDRILALETTAKVILATPKMIKEGVGVNEKSAETLADTQKFCSYFINLYGHNIHHQALVSTVMESHLNERLDASSRLSPSHK